MNYYHLHNLQPEVPKQDLRYTSKVTVDKNLNFHSIEKELDIERGTLKKLNPAFIVGRTHKSNNRMEIYIPSTKYMDFLMNYQNELYQNILAEKAEKEALIEQERLEQTIVKRDTIMELGKLVNNFMDIISTSGRREFNIPHAMRSNLSYLRA
jgi:hypothetical protein